MSTSGKLYTNPLQGCRVLVTRAAEQAAGFSEQLRQRGAVVVECPTISLVAPASWVPVDEALQNLHVFDWLILTSVNGVRFFFDRMQEHGLGLQLLSHCNICAVGPKTAEALEQLGILPNLIPDQFTGEGVVAAFGQLDLQGKRVLFPKADGARDLIPDQLRTRGAMVVDPVVYCNLIPDRLPEQAQQALEQHQLDVAVFSSPSTVRNLAALVGGADQLQQLLAEVVVASIGPVTTKACRQVGLEVGIEPAEATLDDLLQAMERHFSEKQKQQGPDG